MQCLCVSHLTHFLVALNSEKTNAESMEPKKLVWTRASLIRYITSPHTSVIRTSHIILACVGARGAIGFAYKPYLLGGTMHTCVGAPGAVNFAYKPYLLGGTMHTHALMAGRVCIVNFAYHPCLRGGTMCYTHCLPYLCGGAMCCKLG